MLDSLKYGTQHPPQRRIDEGHLIWRHRERVIGLGTGEAVTGDKRAS